MAKKQNLYLFSFPGGAPAPQTPRVASVERQLLQGVLGRISGALVGRAPAPQEVSRRTSCRCSLRIHAGSSQETLGELPARRGFGRRKPRGVWGAGAPQRAKNNTYFCSWPRPGRQISSLEAIFHNIEYLFGAVIQGSEGSLLRSAAPQEGRSETSEPQTSIGDPSPCAG